MCSARSCGAAVELWLLVLSGMSMDLIRAWLVAPLELCAVEGPRACAGPTHFSFLHDPSSFPSHVLPLIWPLSLALTSPQKPCSQQVTSTPWLCLTPCLTPWRQPLGNQVCRLLLLQGKWMCCVLALHFHPDLSISASLDDPLAANTSARGFMAARNLRGAFPKDANPKVFNRIKTLQRAGDWGWV